MIVAFMIRWLYGKFQKTLKSIHHVYTDGLCEAGVERSAKREMTFIYYFTYFWIVWGFRGFLCCFLGPYLWHMEVPRLEVKSDLQLPAYTTATATATPDQSCICNLHHSSHQCWILNPLREARDWTHNLMVPSQISFWCTTTGTPRVFINKHKKYF